MKFNIDKKSALSIAAVIAVGIVLALLIVFWKGDSTPAPEGGEHAEETAETKAEHGDEKEEGHAEEPGLIEMSPQQIQTAGIATATAGPAAIRTELVLPGEVRFNEDRTGRGRIGRCGQPLCPASSVYRCRRRKTPRPG